MTINFYIFNSFIEVGIFSNVNGKTIITKGRVTGWNMNVKILQ